MARTKMTSRVNPDARPQGSKAVFNQQEEATPPNSFSCAKCERKFAQRRNLIRHERQFHGKGTFKYQCPLSPKRMYSRRGDLRRHYVDQHSDADMEEVDDTDAIEVTNEDQCQERTPKKAKVKQTSVLTSSGLEFSGAEIPRSAAGVRVGAELPHSATGVVSGAGPSGPIGD